MYVLNYACIIAWFGNDLYGHWTLCSPWWHLSSGTLSVRVCSKSCLYAFVVVAVWSGCQRPRTHKFDKPAFPSGHRHHQEPEPTNLLPEPVHCCLQWGRGCWLHRHPNPCQWRWYWGQWFGGLFRLSVWQTGWLMGQFLWINSLTRGGGGGLDSSTS